MSHAKPTFKMVGWILGKEGKQDKYWRDNVPRPCYMVRQEDLRNMDDLMKEMQ